MAFAVVAKKPAEERATVLTNAAAANLWDIDIAGPPKFPARRVFASLVDTKDARTRCRIDLAQTWGMKFLDGHELEGCHSLTPTSFFQK
jgi:hypothetical protein